MAIESLHSFGTNLNVPVPVPVPRSAEAFGKLLTLSRAVEDAYRDRDALSAAVADVRNRSASDLGDAFYNDPTMSVDEPNEDVIAAQKIADDAQARLEGLVAAQNRAHQEFSAAADADGPAWAKAVAAKVPASLTKLATAIKLARDAEAELYETLGWRQGRSEHVLTVKLVPGSYAVHLGPAADELGRALAAATEQFEGLKPARGAK